MVPSLRKLALSALLPLTLAACAQDVGDSSERIALSRYVHDGPPSLTLYTMINNRTGAGAHTSLMVNGSQRVIFDPAGSVVHKTIPERGDVLYGVTPQVEDFYKRAHARTSYHVVIQKAVVSPEVAEMALNRVIGNGAVANAKCALSTSTIISALPGFQSIKPGWYPKKLMEQFGQIPGVTTQRLYEYDDDDKSVALRAYDKKLVAQSMARQAAKKASAE